MPEPDAALLHGRCNRLLEQIQRGKYKTHCEISTELRSIMDGLEELLIS
jgi:hypothetical protein